MAFPTPYDEHVMASSPLLFWSMTDFNDPVGDQLPGGVGGPHPGTRGSHGGDPLPTFGAEGPFEACHAGDRAMEFNKAYRHYVYRSAWAGWVNDVSMGLEAWYLLYENPSEFSMIAQNRNVTRPSGDPDIVRLQVADFGGSAGVTLNNGMSSFLYNADVSGALNTWHYLAWGREGDGSFTVWHDAVPIVSGVNTVAVSAREFSVGSDKPDIGILSLLEDERTHGRICRVAAYDYGITQDQVEERWELGQCLGAAAPLLRQRQRGL